MPEHATELFSRQYSPCKVHIGLQTRGGQRIDCQSFFVQGHRMPPECRASTTSPLADVAPFDVLGCGLLSLCMVSFSLALDLPAGEGRLAWSAALFTGSALIVLRYVVYARRHENPPFQLRLFLEPNFSVGLVGNLACRIGSSAMPFLLPLLLQLQLGYTPLQSGLMMLPAAIAGTIPSRGLRRWYDAWATRIPARQYGAGGGGHQCRSPSSRTVGPCPCSSCNWPCSVRPTRCISRP